MPAKRIAIIGNQAFAMRNFRASLIATLVAMGVEVFALAPDYSDADRIAIRQLGAKPVDYPLKRASISPLHDLTTLRQLTSMLREIGPDIVLSFSAKPVVFGTLAASRAGVSMRYALIEGLGHVFIQTTGLRAQLLRWVVGALYRFALGRATRTFFLNEDDRQDFLTAGLVGQDKSSTIGAIGVDLDEWRPATAVTNPLTFLFIGRLLREKGVAELVEAARRVKLRHPSTRFIVLGAPDSNPSSFSMEQASDWVSEGVIEWPGQVDVKPWLAQSSVFVLPSYREGVPRSTQEAMSMARPVITTDVPGCRVTVEDGLNGFLVPPKDVDALERAMLRFVDNPGLIASMGLASRRIAEKLFDAKKSNAAILSAMQITAPHLRTGHDIR